MTRRAFFVAGDRIIHIANPSGAGTSYQAQAHVLLPGAEAGPLSQEAAETVLVVEDGTIEVMVNGMASFVGAGGFVRIPPKTWFAYRNDTDRAAHILCRTAPIQPARRGCRITIQIAAA
jgi:mannose-6-phosphate isomerase-like protein (cupin superfamily)